MANTQKNTTFKAVHKGEVIELMGKTIVDQVYLDDTTKLSPKIAEIVAAINLRAKIDAVNTLISNLRTELTKYTDDEIDTLSEEVKTKATTAAVNNLITSLRNELTSYTNSEIAKVNTSVDTKASTDDMNSALTALENELIAYVKSEIANLINSAPETLDTLGEVADALAENETVIEALNAAIGTKAASADLTSHTGNTSNPHKVTKSQIGLGNVDNTADANKSVKYATSAGSATKATTDTDGNNIGDTYTKKSDLSSASVKYATSAGSATKASSDENGNNIANTYATKDEVKAASSGSNVYIAESIPDIMTTSDICFVVRSSTTV